MLDKFVEQIPNWMRWILVFPCSLLVTFVVGWLIHLAFDHGAALAHVGAIVSGIAYIFVALTVAHIVAPAAKRLVCVFLGIFILGDLLMTYTMTQSTLISDSFNQEESDLSLLFSLLRTEDYNAIPYAEILKIIGVVIGGVVFWIGKLRNQAATRNTRF